MGEHIVTVKLDTNIVAYMFIISIYRVCITVESTSSKYNVIARLVTKHSLNGPKENAEDPRTSQYGSFEFGVLAG